MAETIEEKIKGYRTAPFDARFPNTNQTRNCFQNYLGEDMINMLCYQESVQTQDKHCKWKILEFVSMCTAIYISNIFYVSLTFGWNAVETLANRFIQHFNPSIRSACISLSLFQLANGHLHSYYSQGILSKIWPPCDIDVIVKTTALP